ncbi:MAG: hypothetical protein QOD98_2471 [Nocardioidaceae bacterium]|jgi:uncharacterized protein (DUF885 family)|nr:hypothetical protein [Nocardioidaceae bacterium]
MREADDIAERFVVDMAAADPIMATFAGIAGHEHELPDYTPDGFAAREELLRQARTAMAAATPSDERERVAQSSFLERAEVGLAQDEAHTGQSRVNVIESAAHYIRGAFDLMATETEEDWSAISARLAAVPQALADYRATLLAEADHGHVSARRQMIEAASQIRGWTGRSGSGGDVFAQLVAQTSNGEPGHVSALLESDLARNAVLASTAYAAFATFLEQELAPRGLDKEAVGREAYARDSRYFLGTEIDLDETYAWGWEELHRIETEMLQISASIAGAGATIAEAVAAIESDPARRIDGAEHFRQWMQDLADRTLADMADTHFDIPEPIRRIDCRIAPTHDGGIYYTPPSEDFTRPGAMWWSIPEGVTTFHPWREVTTVFHEGVPGHHLQCAQTAYRKDVLNRWQRSVCWVSGHGEGWALYAERLMDELGYLEDPADKLGMLDGQGFRAARVIVDIGMHLELEIPRDNPFGFHPGERWTGELGLEFMRQHARMDDANIVFEVNRYLGWPAQAPSYKVGERIWLQARDDVKARQGAAFDLKAFHRAALDLGSLGLDPMREALARF